MALELNDLMTLKSLENGHSGMTPYEQFKVGHMQSKRPSGVGIAGLAVGIGAAVAVIGVGIYANAKANAARDIAETANAGTAQLLNRLATQYDQVFATERAERIAGDQFTFTQTQTDTQSGSQQGTLSSTQQAELNQAQQLMFGLSTGEYSRNPQRVTIWRDAQACPCPAGGCGCNS